MLQAPDRAVLIALAAALAVNVGALTLGAAPWLAATLGACLGLCAAAGLDAATGRRAAAPKARPAKPPADAQGYGPAVLAQLPIGLVLLGREGRVLLQNEAAEDMLERRVTGMHCTAALRAPAILEAINRALDDGVGAEIDTTLLRSSERIVHAYVRPLPPSASPDGPRVVVLLEDRTRMKKAEALRRDFVANASHELKTPLASISGFIETLQGHARDDPEATERFLAIMAAQAERMKRLVEDLLSLNRIEINEHVQPREPLDLAELVWEIAGALRPIADAAGARIEIALPQSGLMVRGDRHQIGQVFMNLIDNAIKYAGSDGPIRIEPASAPSGRPGLIGIGVRDHGPGVAREHIPRLTERFYRVNAARSREQGGTGLGLPIVKHVLNPQPGDLTIAKIGRASWRVIV